MAKPGEQVSNPISGETVTFQRTSNGGPAKVIEFDLELRPVAAPGGMPHRHRPVEVFDVTSGELLALIAGQGLVRAKPGETIKVPRDRWHVIFAYKRTTAKVKITPGMHFDELIATGAAVGSGDVKPTTLRKLANLMREHDCVPRVP